MTEKTVYIAFDGKEFEDENECERYESKELQNKYGKDLLVYDENGKLIALDNDYWLSHSGAYIICKAEKALIYLNKICDYNGVNNVDYDGNFPASFYYDFTTYKWKEIKSRIKELQDEIDILNKYIVKE